MKSFYELDKVERRKLKREFLKTEYGKQLNIAFIGYLILVFICAFIIGINAGFTGSLAFSEIVFWCVLGIIIFGIQSMLIDCEIRRSLIDWYKEKNK